MTERLPSPLFPTISLKVVGLNFSIQGEELLAFFGAETPEEEEAEDILAEDCAEAPLRQIGLELGGALICLFGALPALLYYSLFAVH